MIDPKLLRQNPEKLAVNLKRRGVILNIDRLNELEQQRKTLQESTQSLQNQRNVHSKAIGQAKAKGDNADSLMAEVNTINQALKTQETQLNEIQTALQTYLATLPNWLDDSVPEGKDEADNVEVRTWGTPATLAFEPQDHITLGEKLHGIDFEAASKLSGARFVMLKGDIARLQRALIQFMLDTHIDTHGYQETYVPYLVKRDCFYGAGQLPKFDEDFFDIAGDHDLSLISTAEIPLTNSARNHIFQAQELPVQLVAHTPCFRSEAGSYGRDTRGMIRQHQFEKVELVHFVKPEDSFAALERLTQHAETILQKLELPYRVVNLCSGDIGFGATKTYDLEVWMPSQGTYREISSCSNCLDFQARRLQARWKNPETGKNELIHTLNGSGVAAGRALIAILENYQTAAGHIRIPDVLQPYMGGKTIIQ